MLRAVPTALIVALLAACSSSPPPRPGNPYAGSREPTFTARAESPRRVDAEPAKAVNPCAPTREHLDSDYTAGGLYAPGVADGGPSSAIDISGLVEPVPRDEPRARQGNRSPYKVLGKSYRVLDSAKGFRERGLASWYGTKFNGRATSSGELYDICLFTAAHKTLPLPSYVRVTNLDNGRSMIVRVNDRGPFHPGRVMDLSYAAAVRLGVDRTGTARVELEAVGPGDSLPGDRQAAVSEPAGRPATRFDAAGRGDGDSIIQAGSFSEKANARRLADRLQDGGVGRVDVDHADVDGRDVWRVRIGPVDRDEMDGVLARLRGLGVLNPRVFSQ